ncbi:transmembrane protein 256 isoform X1 [Gopherus flavomarginatus]|uniref:transmembrane protein 256 isoform X1 n=1 Tax=Gopherus flavomarginatus TaxID=286002 RepID=UPI0021CBCB89|nr:transmembrane protein 256 isoform X1 [Gopherus flavomarginatus]
MAGSWGRVGALSGAGAVGAAAYGAHALRDGQQVPLPPQPGAAGRPPLPPAPAGRRAAQLRDGTLLWPPLLPRLEWRPDFQQSGPLWGLPPDPRLAGDGSVTPPAPRGPLPPSLWGRGPPIPPTALWLIGVPLPPPPHRWPRPPS